MDPVIPRSLSAVLLVWGALLLLMFSGRMYSTDVLAQYEVAGSFIGNTPFMTVSGDYGWIVQGAEAGKYVPHGAGFSLLLVPAAIAGKILGLTAGKVCTALTNAVLSLSLVGFWYACARRKYSSLNAGRFLAVAAGSMILVYGKISFDVTAAAAAAMAGYWFFLGGRNTSAGICMGLALLIRLDSFLLLPLFWKDWKSFRSLIYGMVPFVLAILFLNWYRFGSPFSDGHSQDPAVGLAPFRGGIVGLLLSPGKGLLYYSPLCILALFHQKDWRLWTPFVLSLIFHGMLYDWTGGTGWGPRFLFTSLPFLLLPLSAGDTGGWVFWTVAALGIAVNVMAVWSNPSILEQTAGADLFDAASRQEVIWTYSSSPLFLALRNFGRGIPDMFGAYAASSAGLPAWTGASVQAAAAAVMAWLGFRKLEGASDTA